MIPNVVKRAWVVALLGMVAAVLIYAGPSGRPEPATAASPGATVSTLLSCPNVDGSADDKVTIPDILAVVQAYFDDFPSTNYVYMYDLVGPYNPELGPPQVGGLQRIDDIIAVVNRYFEFCPLVDTQVAQATRWLLVQHPELLTESTTALAAAGYTQPSEIPLPVPGQGVHYGKLSAWDDHFDPTEPEGLVYSNGRLAAQLHVVDGAMVGWVPEDPGPSEGPCGDGIDNGGDGDTDGADPDCLVGTPVPPPPQDVDIDRFAYCEFGVACSWAGDEGWHMHYNQCFIHIGTPYAQPIAAQSLADCKAAQEGTNEGAGTMSFVERMGWMGHLWNWLPNANLESDVNGTMNGRFADCFPDTQGWKAHNCPQ